jgi:ubiquinone/menaquinone biosynthesis C-methylase UbiE
MNNGVQMAEPHRIRSGPSSEVLAMAHWKRALRICAYGLAFLLILFAFNECSKTINTLNALKAIESDRDQWQRPTDVITAMNISRGNIVADVGSGAGYFSLKLADTVGSSGQVLAVDIDRLQLRFVWLRSFLAGGRNVHIRLANADDPHLPNGGVDAILVANTYHELPHRDLVLEGLRAALRPGGRLVVIDRSTFGQDAEALHHEVSSDVVDFDLRRASFEVLPREDHFIDRPTGERWWMIIARKPG